MSGYNSETLSEVVARRRAIKCPGCGQPGRVVAPAVIMYHPGGGVAQASLDARLYQCPTCGVRFALSVSE